MTRRSKRALTKGHKTASRGPTPTPENRGRTGAKKLNGGVDPSVGEATQFKPGESGNPGGRPKGVIGAKLLNQLLAGEEEDLLEIVKAVIAQARKGNTKAFAEIRNTVDGSPVQMHTGAEGGPIFHVIRYEKDPPTPAVMVPDKPALADHDAGRDAPTPAVRTPKKPRLAAGPEPEEPESAAESARRLDNLRRAGQDMSRVVEPVPRPAWER